MAGLLDLTSQQGMMAQNAADDALEAQGKLYEHNEGIKAQNWQEAGKIVTSLADSYGKYRGAQRQQSVIGGALRNMFSSTGDQ